MRDWIILRRASQIIFLVIFVGLFPSEIFFKIDPLITIVVSLSERVILSGLFFSFFTLFLTLIFGRFFCGWVCPLGTTIDVVGWIRKRLPELRESTNRRLRRVKFYILGFILIFSLLGVQLAWVFDPMVIMARFVSLNFIPSVTFILDRLFIVIIKNFHLYGQFYDFYRKLKASIFGSNIYSFSHSGIILSLFLFICGMAILLKRFWCRILCPLGALYSIVAKFSFLRRTVERCKICDICSSRCRMGAIKEDLGYIKGECILCMDCLYNCPEHVTQFRWKSIKQV